jgi:hypothetical protein
MRKADLAKNHVPFDNALARYRAFMTKVFAAKHVVADAQEKRDLAESILLRLTANWEFFLNEHLVDCVNKSPSQLSAFLGVPLPSNPNKALCHALVFGSGYRDFHSFADIVGLSKKLLPDLANPFKNVSRSHQAKIDEAYAIRNYLSHYSSASNRALMKIYKEKYNMNKFLEPGQFLLAYECERLWAYFTAFEGASADMKTFYARM